MITAQLAAALQLEVLTPGTEKPIEGVFCGDLLSLAMSKAEENDVWITVMCNINAIGVAVLCDVACILYAEGLRPDEEALARAREEGVCLLSSPLSAFQLAVSLGNLLEL